jgi:hypothetical protein
MNELPEEENSISYTTHFHFSREDEKVLNVSDRCQKGLSGMKEAVIEKISLNESQDEEMRQTGRHCPELCVEVSGRSPTGDVKLTEGGSVPQPNTSDHQKRSCQLGKALLVLLV